MEISACPELGGDNLNFSVYRYYLKPHKRNVFTFLLIMDLPAPHRPLAYMLISIKPMDLILILSAKAWTPGMGVGSAYGSRARQVEKGLRPGSWVIGTEVGGMSKNSKESL